MNQVKDKNSERKTLFVSLILSFPGPIILGYSMLSGVNATQIADFVRRTFELLSILLAYIIYELSLHWKGNKNDLKRRWEVFTQRFTGVSMCISGLIMLYLAIFDVAKDKGSIIPSLVFAILGALVNAKLYSNYRRFSNASNNIILEVQAKLCRVKLFLECWMTGILLVYFFSTSEIAGYYADLIGSSSISLYVIWNGIHVFKNTKQEIHKEDQYEAG